VAPSPIANDLRKERQVKTHGVEVWEQLFPNQASQVVQLDVWQRTLAFVHLEEHVKHLVHQSRGLARRKYLRVEDNAEGKDVQPHEPVKTATKRGLEDVSNGARNS
jgi:hypothetical protein